MKLTCKKCGQTKDSTEFYKSSKNLSGFSVAACKECVIARDKKSFNARQTGNTLTCKCCGKTRDTSEFSQHSDCASGFDTSRCKPCKKAKGSWANQPLNKKMFNRAKHRAKLRGWEFNIELTDIDIPTHCPVFGQLLVYGDIDWTYSIDRKDSTKGYVKDNITIISNRANRAKNDLTISEVRALLKYMEETKE